MSCNMEAKLKNVIQAEPGEPWWVKEWAERIWDRFRKYQLVAVSMEGLPTGPSDLESPGDLVAGGGSDDKV